MTPEVKLVDDYNTWYLGAGQSADETTLRSELKKYITDKTVLHEVASLPWGGTMVGFDGWVRLGHKSAPIVQKIGDLIELSSPTYYQSGNVVIHEITLTIKSTAAAPKPFVMGLMEKYTIENGKIAQIDEFYADTASLVHRFAVLGALPDKKKP
jgi:ketosteroid isomerase-like protein